MEYCNGGDLADYLSGMCSEDNFITKFLKYNKTLKFIYVYSI